MAVGCLSPAPRDVFVNAYAGSKSTSGLKYALLPDMDGVEVTDLQFLETCTLLRPALAAKGLVEINDPRAADVFVFVSYSMGTPITQTSGGPTYGQISPATTSSYFGTTSGASGTYTTQGTISRPATYGINGYETHTRVIYPARLELKAVDVAEYRRSKEPVFFWSIAGATEARGGDLRATMPLLIAGLSDFIGTSTGRHIAIRIAPDGSKSVVPQRRGLW